MAKKDKNFQIVGRILDRNNQNPLPGVRVEAWDKDLIHDDLVGSSVTDADGTFRIEFNADYFSELFGDRKPDLFFRVFQNGTVLQSTEDSGTPELMRTRS
jgi:hypothetical protein